MKNKITQILLDFCNKKDYELLQASIVGSFVYLAGTKFKPNDIDVLCVVKSKKEFNSNQSYYYNLNNLQLDFQFVDYNKYLELLKKNHIFYIESLLVPEEFKIKKSKIKFIFNEIKALESLKDNCNETLNKANKNFNLGNYKKGKKQVLQIFRICEFVHDLINNENIKFQSGNELNSFIDDEKIELKDWIDFILSIDPKYKKYTLFLK